MAKILLVEDDKSIVTNLTEFLTGEGYEVKSASGQSGALSLLADHQFDLVLLDISLSDGNGFTVCSAIKKRMRYTRYFPYGIGRRIQHRYRV